MTATHGRIDVHAHLIPAVDDGCADMAQSLECARMLVAAGYSHAFCTPHIWPHLPHNNPGAIRQRTRELQDQLDRAGIPLAVLPGGELNLRPEIVCTRPQDVVTYALNRRYCLFDLWADELPGHFESSVRFLQSLGLTVILAHPERMAAVQLRPSLADYFASLGLLLQGNLQCFSDPEDAHTRRVAERYLAEGRYFMLGTDTHRPNTLACRLDGLKRAIALAGDREIDRLTIDNPRRLLPEAL